MTGGTGFAGGGPGGGGARLRNTDFVNNGIVQGGVGAGVSTGGSGLVTLGNVTVTNTGLIQGGSGRTGGAGISGQVTAVTNTGTIRGGTGVVGSNSAYGILSQVNFQLINEGTIEGGTGGAGFVGGVATFLLSNSGAIRAGAGQANAIQISNSAFSRLDLSLRAGSEIVGNVVASVLGTNDTLRLGGDTDWTLDGGLGSTSQYRNFDTLEKTGASTWTVTGSGDFAGATNILGGTLLVNGSLAGSALTVQSGARLGGIGTVGATTLASGGRIAPGNSIGTLTINGAYVQGAGSVYEVELDPTTVTSDLIRVNGLATLATGASLSILNYTGGAFVAGQRYTILTSTGLTGTFDSVDLPVSAFLNLRSSTDAFNAYLAVVQTRAIADIGTTPNEVGVGNSIDSLPDGNTVRDGVLNQATVEAARGALGQLGGEIYASTKSALVNESWLLRSAVNDRLRSAFAAVGAAPMAAMNYGSADPAPSVTGPMPRLVPSDRFAAWVQGYGSWSRIDGDGNSSALKHSTGGFVLGADVAVLDTLRFGVVAGYSRTDIDVDRRLSSSESDNYHLGLYGGGQWGALSLRLGASSTWHDIETRRSVVAAGLGTSLRADRDAGTAQLFGEFGYRIDLGPVAFEPFAGLAYVNLRSNGISEVGGAAALSGTSDDTSLGYSTPGLRASTSARIQGMDLTLRGALGWRHAFGDVDPKATLAFAGSIPFTITGAPIARNAALVEAGLDLVIDANASLGVTYAGQLAEDAQDQVLKANLAVRF
jgi:outer membrane autotransporter protein